MRTNAIGLLVIAAAVAGVVGYKLVTKQNEPAATAPAVNARILLYADLGEADSECGCGEIIRAVRDASRHGVPTRENDDALGRELEVTVSPTVVILDAKGHEQARYEGESDATIARLLDSLAKLETETPAR